MNKLNLIIANSKQFIKWLWHADNIRLRQKLIVIGSQYLVNLGVPIPVLDRFSAALLRWVLRQYFNLDEAEFINLGKVTGVTKSTSWIKRQLASLMRDISKSLPWGVITISLKEGAEFVLPVSDIFIATYEFHKALKMLPEAAELFVRFSKIFRSH